MAHEGRTCAQDLGVAAATAAITYIRDMREGERKGSWISANHRHVPEPFESLEAWRPWCVSIHALHQTTDWEILMKRPWPGTAKTRCIIGLAMGLRTVSGAYHKEVMSQPKLSPQALARPCLLYSSLDLWRGSEILN